MSRRRAVPRFGSFLVEIAIPDMAAATASIQFPLAAITGTLADLRSNHCKTDRRRAACGRKPARVRRSLRSHRQESVYHKSHSAAFSRSRVVGSESRPTTALASVSRPSSENCESIMFHPEGRELCQSLPSRRFARTSLDGRVRSRVHETINGNPQVHHHGIFTRQPHSCWSVPLHRRYGCLQQNRALRICTDSEINVGVKPERLCLTDDR